MSFKVGDKVVANKEMPHLIKMNFTKDSLFTIKHIERYGGVTGSNYVFLTFDEVADHDIGGGLLEGCFELFNSNRKDRIQTFFNE